jgi:hypothetical protein
MIDEKQFWEHVRKWENDSKYAPSTTQILSHPSVTTIIQMGPEAIPLALEAMKENFHLTYVLHKLTGEWPVKDEFKGNGPKIIECWRKWAQKHGYKI